jgi:hypothetical protein
MWVEEFPQESGDFLWVAMWGCDCCVHKSGIAWVYDVTGDKEEELPLTHYQVGDKVLGISWEGAEPYFKDNDKKAPIVDGWLKLPSLPKRRVCS